jgi:S1-C subfamily serine protease
MIGGSACYLSARQTGPPIRLHTSVQAAEVAENPTVAAKLSKRFNLIADAADIAAPAVVYVQVYTQHPWSKCEQVSSGSGFIVSEDGTILTNAHVVSSARQVKIKLNNGNSYTATVCEIDQVADLAMLKIQPNERLPVIKLGTSSSLRAGEWVAAIGSPLSLSNSVTAGVVSTVGRKSKELGLMHTDIDYIQTDATITTGNSGGPLVNLDGEVIGINTMTTVPGISFAIPVDRAKKFLKEVEALRKHPGPSKQRYIGISMMSLNASLIETLQSRLENFPDVESGVFVAKVTSDSPAERGGLGAGDVIVEINGQAVAQSSDVFNSLQRSETLQMRVRRGKHKINLNITPETMPFH